jgi:hypothetical protein
MKEREREVSKERTVGEEEMMIKGNVLANFEKCYRAQ